MLTCPMCEGRKESEAVLCGHGHCQIKMVKCSLCEGAGQVTEDHAERYREGRRRRDDRVARGKSLREEANRLGISASALSRIERGVA